MHWSRAEDVLYQAGGLSGRTMVTCSLPMNDADTELVVAHTSSGGEELARRVPGTPARGGQPAGVARMIVSQGMTLAVIGIVPGMAGAFMVARAMRALLFGIAPADPPTVMVAVGLVVLMTLAESLLPALRAVRVSPMLALKAD